MEQNFLIKRLKNYNFVLIYKWHSRSRIR